MIAGIITEDGVPAIEVEAGGEQWQAIIDTGFNGELELPERLRFHVNAQFVGRLTSLLAANQRVEEDVYEDSILACLGIVFQNGLARPIFPSFDQSGPSCGADRLVRP